MKNYYRLIFLATASIITIKSYAQNAAIVMPVNGLCAHRGGMDTHPENTLTAFNYSILAGVQMIEFDIQFSKDSALVMMHDDSVDRTTDGHGNVADLTLEQLKRLDAGIKKGPEFQGTKLPSLEETLAIMPRNIWLNCHLKGGSALGRAVALAVQKANRLHQSLLACSEEAAKGAKAVVPQIIICNADNKYRQDNKKYVAATISQQDAFIQLLALGTSEQRKPFIMQLKRNHIMINYFYAQRAEQAAGLWEEGIDFILVNDLPLFLPEMEKAGIKKVINTF